MSKGNGQQEAKKQVQAQDQTRIQEEQQKYIQDLMDGKQPIKNELVRYLVEELKNNNTELAAVLKTHRQAEEVMTQTRQRITELRGIGRKYMQDIIAHRDGDDSEDRKLVPPTPIPQPVV